MELVNKCHFLGLALLRLPSTLQPQFISTETAGAGAQQLNHAICCNRRPTEVYWRVLSGAFSTLWASVSLSRTNMVKGFDELGSPSTHGFCNTF